MIATFQLLYLVPIGFSQSLQDQISMSPDCSCAGTCSYTLCQENTGRQSTRAPHYFPIWLEINDVNVLRLKIDKIVSALLSNKRN